MVPPVIVMVQQGAEKAIRPPACRENLADPGKGIAPPGGNRKRMRFPRPRATLPPRPVQPAPTAGQRPTRRGRSARLGAGRRWPGGFGPRQAWDQRGAVAGAMAPARRRYALVLRLGSRCRNQCGHCRPRKHHHPAQGAHQSLRPRASPLYRAFHVAGHLAWASSPHHPSAAAGGHCCHTANHRADAAGQRVRCDCSKHCRGLAMACPAERGSLSLAGWCHSARRPHHLCPASGTETQRDDGMATSARACICPTARPPAGVPRVTAGVVRLRVCPEQTKPGSVSPASRSSIARNRTRRRQPEEDVFSPWHSGGHSGGHPAAAVRRPEACCGGRDGICALHGRAQCPTGPACPARCSPAPVLPLMTRAIAAGAAWRVRRRAGINL